MHKVYIKHLPKDKLLYELWKRAKQTPYLQYCKDIDITVSQEQVRDDINNMISNNRKIDITTYYGRLLFIDISNDTVDTTYYNMHNGRESAETIIAFLKKEELKKTELTYYKFY